MALVFNSRLSSLLGLLQDQDPYLLRTPGFLRLQTGYATAVEARIERLLHHLLSCWQWPTQAISLHLSHSLLLHPCRTCDVTLDVH